MSDPRSMRTANVEYPFHDRDMLATACGRVCMHRRRSTSLPCCQSAARNQSVDDGIWLVSFVHSRIYRSGAEDGATFLHVRDDARDGFA